MSQTIDIPIALYDHEVALAQAGTLKRLIREDALAHHQDRYGIVYTWEDKRFALVKPWRGHKPEVVGEITEPGMHEPLTVQQLAEGGMTEASFGVWYQRVLERHVLFNGPYEFRQPDVYLAKLELLNP